MLSTTNANRLALSLGILCVGLALGLGLVLRRGLRAALPTNTALADPAVKQAVVDELVAQSQGVFDSFPDPMVGRLLEPSMHDRSVPGGVLSSNEWGLRERPYVLPKPKDTVRIVLLGDSYVYGPGVAPDGRAGAFLERALRQRARGIAQAIECLHLGIPSWNILAETNYVRRQLSLLQPDVVFHVVVPNDLDDLAGVRGFGAMASASPQQASRAGVVLGRDYPALYLGISTQNYLISALDHESRTRYAQAAAAIANLAAAVEGNGGRYVLVLNWMGMQPIGLERLTASLRPDQVAMLPFALFKDLRLRLGPNDGHWNQAGHEAVATYLYGIVRSRNLVGALKLDAWEESEALLYRWTAQAENELRDRRRALAGAERPRLVNAIVTNALDPTTAAQIHGGLFRDGAGPYLSVILARAGGDRLRIDGVFLDEPALAHATVTVCVEELEVQRVAYRPGAPFVVEQTLPAALQGREFLNVRLQTDDFVYGGPDLRTPLSLKIDRIAINHAPYAETGR